MFLSTLEPKRFYKKLLRKTRNNYLTAFILSLLLTGLFVVVSMALWTASFSQTWGLKHFKTVFNKNTYKFFISLFFFIICISYWKTFFKKRKILKITKKEIKSWNREFPYGLNSLIKEHLINAYIEKCKSYWWMFFFTGIMFIGSVYCLIIGAFFKWLKPNDVEMFTATMWNNLFKDDFSFSGRSPTKPIDIAFVTFTLLFVLLLNLFALTQYSKSKTIKNIWRVVGYDDEETMDVYNNELRHRWMRVNKRGKIVVMVLLCVIGLVIYLIMKKLIVAVFNRSFNKEV